MPDAGCAATSKDLKEDVFAKLGRPFTSTGLDTALCSVPIPAEGLRFGLSCKSKTELLVLGEDMPNLLKAVTSFLKEQVPKLVSTVCF